MRAMLAECIMRIHLSHHVIAIRANVAGSTMSLPSAGTFNLIKEQICNMKYVTRITGALSLQSPRIVKCEIIPKVKSRARI